MKGALANIGWAVASNPPEDQASARAMKNANAAAICRPAPVSCGSRRDCRSPSQTSAAPSSANTLAVAWADSASGTASVAKPTASRAYDCASTS